MRVAFSVESDFDEWVLKALLERMVGTRVVVVETQLRRGGLDKVIASAPILARIAARQCLDVALFAIDNDGASLHQPEHDWNLGGDCRFCLLKRASHADTIPWRDGARPLFVFVVPVQTIETWLLHLADHHFHDDANILGADYAGRRKLKRLLYGSDNTDLETRWGRAEPLLGKCDPERLGSRSASFRHFRDQVASINAASP